MKLSDEVSPDKETRLQSDVGIPNAAWSSLLEERQNVMLGYVKEPAVRVQPVSMAFVPSAGRTCCNVLVPSSRSVPIVVVVPYTIKDPSDVIAKA